MPLQAAKLAGTGAEKQLQGRMRTAASGIGGSAPGVSQACRAVHTDRSSSTVRTRSRGSAFAGTERGARMSADRAAGEGLEVALSFSSLLLLGLLPGPLSIDRISTVGDLAFEDGCATAGLGGADHGILANKDERTLRSPRGLNIR